MDRLISCEFNMDTACVELKFTDGSMIGLIRLLLRMRLPTICISVRNWTI